MTVTVTYDEQYSAGSRGESEIERLFAYRIKEQTGMDCDVLVTNIGQGAPWHVKVRKSGTKNYYELPEDVSDFLWVFVRNEPIRSYSFTLPFA